jgi:hypothetical protein
MTTDLLSELIDMLTPMLAKLVRAKIDILAASPVEMTPQIAADMARRLGEYAGLTSQNREA